MSEAPVYTPEHPKIVSVVLPGIERYLAAGAKVMREAYAKQQERERVQRELQDVQAQCAALFSAG